MNPELLREKQRTQKEGLVIREITEIQVRIPQCCRDGWENCPHVMQKKRAKRGNIGL